MVLRGFVGSALVLLGGLGISTLPGSSVVMRSDVLGAVRGSEAGRMAALALVMVGLGVLAAQWLRLCRYAALAGDDDAIAFVRHVAVVWSAPLVLAPPLFSRDGWSYAAQGMLVRIGVSPYEHGPGVLRGPIAEAVDPRWLDTAAPYGPVPLWLGGLGAGVTGNPWALAIGHRMVALVGLVLLAWAVPRLARWGGVNPALASAVVLVSPLTLANGVGGLHNDLLMVGLMAAALVLAVERGWWVGALVGGAAAAVKAPGGLVCVGVVLVTLPVAASLSVRVRRLAEVGVVSGGCVVLLGVLTGLGTGWVEALGVPGSLTTPLSVTALADEALGLDVVRTAGGAGALALAAWVALRRPTGDRASAVRSVALVMTVTVVLSPVVHLWYLLWCTPFVAAAALPRQVGVTLIGGSLALGLAAPLDSSLHGAYLMILLGSTLLALIVPMLLLTRTARTRISRIVDPRRAAS